MCFGRNCQLGHCKQLYELCICALARLCAHYKEGVCKQFAQLLIMLGDFF